jgi:phosphatidylinositol alpha-1,6-mannosyltransferase
MHTLVLTEHFLPSMGGSINWLINTYSRYQSNEVVLVSSKQEGDFLVDKTLPFPVERIPMTMTDWDPTIPMSLYRYIQIVRDVRKYYFKYRVEQIHCAKVLPEGLVAWCLNCIQKVPYILYAHGEEIKTGMTSRKFWWLIPKIYNHAELIIANSKNTKSLLEEIGVSSEKIHIIHPGVDVHVFNVGKNSGEIIRQQLNIGDSPILLTVGRLQRRKGHDMVIKALPYVRQKVPEVKYIIVGQGEEFANLRQLIADVGVSESVMMVGHVSDQELPSYYAACDIFVMPNRDIDGDIEGFGMVYLEAAAAGKPVIGGKSGGTQDAILEGIAGLRVDGNSLSDISAAILTFLLDPDKSRQMGESGRRWVEREFAWESVVERTRTLAAAIS